MSSMTYRSLRAADVKHVQAVALVAWQWTYHNIFDAGVIEQFVQTNYAPDRLLATVSDVESGHSFFEVALDGQQIIGFCHIGLTAQEARLFRIYLLPSYIGQGVGSTLLQRGEAWLQGQGISEYSCYVHPLNEIGRQFYERHSFVHRADHDQDDEWYMHKTLPSAPY